MKFNRSVIGLVCRLPLHRQVYKKAKDNAKEKIVKVLNEDSQDAMFEKVIFGRLLTKYLIAVV